MKRIGGTAVICIAFALFSPWQWLTALVLVAAPILLGLWLVAILTDDRLRVTPPVTARENTRPPVPR